MKGLKSTLLAASVALMLSPSAASADADFGAIYTQCGLGGIVGSAVSNKSASQVIAIVTNITWDLGTTASTSYFSSQNTCMNKKVAIAAFINQSYEKLEKEIASGEGEYLDALANLATDQEKTTEYKVDVRTKFAKVVASVEYTSLSRYEKVERLFDIAS